MNMVRAAIIRTPICAISLLQQHRCARLHYLDERAHSRFLCPPGSIMTHDITVLAFFGAGSPGALHCFNCSFVSDV